MPKVNYIGVTEGPYLTPDYSWIANQNTLEFSQPMRVNSGALDAGNTTFRTTYLRPGLAMGQITATGQVKEYDDGDSDGTETLFGILYEGVDMLDAEGVAITTPVMAVLVIGGHIDADQVIGIDANGKTDMRNSGRFLLVEDYAT